MKERRHEIPRQLCCGVVYYKKNIMASMSWTNKWLNSNDAHKEYLFLMEKDLQKIDVARASGRNTFNNFIKKTKMPIMAPQNILGNQ
ncbi:hypothetical protein KGQ29_04735 [Patescibacteria group bacterium]|nr:hypothetical protein [Patescibacteria group bacterium]